MPAPWAMLYFADTACSSMWQSQFSSWPTPKTRDMARMLAHMRLLRALRSPGVSQATGPHL